MNYYVQRYSQQLAHSVMYYIHQTLLSSLEAGPGLYSRRAVFRRDFDDGGNPKYKVFLILTVLDNLCSPI